MEIGRVNIMRGHSRPCRRLSLSRRRAATPASAARRQPAPPPPVTVYHPPPFATPLITVAPLPSPPRHVAETTMRDDSDEDTGTPHIRQNIRRRQPPPPPATPRCWRNVTSHQQQNAEKVSNRAAREIQAAAQRWTLARHVGTNARRCSTTSHARSHA